VEFSSNNHTCFHQDTLWPVGIHREEVVIATTTRHEFRKSLQEQLTRREEDS